MPSVAVAVADELGTPATLYSTVAPGVLVTVAPVIAAPVQSFTTTPTNALPAWGVIPAAAASNENSVGVTIKMLLTVSPLRGCAG